MSTLFDMAEPKELEDIRNRGVAARLTRKEEKAWDALRKKLGGGVRPLSDADALRWAMAKACKDEGIAWPGGAS